MFFLFPIVSIVQYFLTGENFQSFAKLFIEGEFMSLLPQFALIFISSFVLSAQLHAEQNKYVKDNLKVISIYQIEDESSAGFDFFTSQKTH